MKSKLMDEVMDAVGELPDFGNLLLRESGYPHLSNDNFGASSVITEEYKADQQRKNQRMRDTLEAMPKQSQSDAWSEAGTKPRKACFCETYHHWDDSKWVQFWNGKHWCAIGMSIHEATAKKNMKSHYQFPQWREVQP